MAGRASTLNNGGAVILSGQRSPVAESKQRSYRIPATKINAAIPIGWRRFLLLVPARLGPASYQIATK